MKTVTFRVVHRMGAGQSYDFVSGRTSDGLPLRILTVLDEYTRECLAIDVGRNLTSEDVLDRLTELFVSPGLPGSISAPTTGRSSPPRRSGDGCPVLE